MTFLGPVFRSVSPCVDSGSIKVDDQDETPDDQAQVGAD